MKRADVLIVGAGMSGLTAALWGIRLGLDCLVLERGETPGGQLHWIQDPLIDFPGFTGTGAELSHLMTGQIAGKARLQTGVLVERILTEQESQSPDFQVLTSDGFVQAKAVLVASGLRPRRLKELESFEGRGLVYTSRPRREFAGKNLVIAGGGDGAVENASLLMHQWESITLVHRGASLRAQHGLTEKLAGAKNVRVMLESRITSAKGKDVLESVTVEGPAGSVELPCERVLAKIGFETESDLLSSEARRYTHPGCLVRVNDEQMALYDTGDMPLDSRPVWAAGDVCASQPSLVVAAGQACVAMRSIERYLRGD